MKAVLIQDAAVEPVTVTQVKNHLRVTEDLEDIIIAGLITSARKVVEQITRRALIHQTWKLFLDGFPTRDSIELPYPPLAEVVSVDYYDANGELQTLDPALDQTDNRSTPGEIVLSATGAWPAVESDKVNAVQVEYIAGYGATAAAVPEPIRLAIIHLASHWFENREPFSQSQLFQVPATFELILMPYRFLRLK